MQGVSALLSAFRDYLAGEERSEATIEKYLRDICTFFRFLDRTGEMTREAVIAYKQELAGRYAVSSVNSMLAALNAYFQFAGRQELRVKPLRVQRRIFCASEELLTVAEYHALLDAAVRGGRKRLWLLLQALCSTGIRVSELGFITVEAARRRRATVRCKCKCRLVFLPAELCRALLAYCRERNICSGPIFITRGGRPLDRSNIWREMKALCAAAGVAQKKVFPHNLRHLFASTYYREEKDLARLADLLGHSSVETTRLYILTTGEEQEKQVEALGLLAS